MKGPASQFSLGVPHTRAFAKLPSTLSNLEDSASDPEDFSFKPLALVKQPGGWGRPQDPLWTPPHWSEVGVKHVHCFLDSCRSRKGARDRETLA